MGLLCFRLVWGLIGGRWSRFASFIYAPGTVLRYRVVDEDAVTPEVDALLGRR
jgi:cytochrome b